MRVQILKAVPPLTVLQRWTQLLDAVPLRILNTLTRDPNPGCSSAPDLTPTRDRTPDCSLTPDVIPTLNSISRKSSTSVKHSTSGTSANIYNPHASNSPSNKHSQSNESIHDVFKNIKSFQEGGLKHKKLTDKILFMICKDNQPVATVEGEGF